MSESIDNPHRIRIDWTVNLTTLASISIALATGAITITQIQAQNDKRLALLEAARAQQISIDAQQDNALRDQLQLIRQSLARIEDAQQRALESRGR